MCWTFFIFIWFLCIQPGLMQTTSWDLVTSPVVFGKPVELRCTVTVNDSCCSVRTRIWRKGSTTILANGDTRLPSKKYRESLDAPNKQFSLIINDLSEEDVDVVYTCAYGNVSPQKTLTQNDSFEYHPTESECPVEIHNGELVGTLIVNMSAPYPSVTAQYGDSNFTSNLTTVITPVAGSTKFYTINSSLKGNATCRNDEKFTLSVLTGVTTTNICNNVTLCTGGIHDGKCDTCAEKCFVWAVIGTFVTASLIVIFTSVCRYIEVCRLLELCENPLPQPILVVVRSVIVSIIVDAIVAVPIGYNVCHCIDGTEPWFIILGASGTGIYALIVVWCDMRYAKGLWFNILGVLGVLATFILTIVVVIGTLITVAVRAGLYVKRDGAEPWLILLCAFGIAGTFKLFVHATTRRECAADPWCILLGVLAIGICPTFITMMVRSGDGTYPWVILCVVLVTFSIVPCVAVIVVLCKRRVARIKARRSIDEIFCEYAPDMQSSGQM